MTWLIAILAGLLVAWLLLLVILWTLRPRGVPARELVRVVPDLLRLARSVLTDGSAPIDVRLAVGCALLWIISPIDPIPEFLPLVGQLDDVIVTIVALRYVRYRMGRDELRCRWAGSDTGFAILSTIMG